MSKSAFARELSNRLGVRVSRQMLDKYHVRGMPLDSVDSAIEWLLYNSVGEPHRRAEALLKRGGTQVATSLPSGATLQPPDFCGALKPDPVLTVADGAKFYLPVLAPADIVTLSQLLQQRVPELAQCSPAMAGAVQRAIREAICDWSLGEYCPHCRRAVGIVEPDEPEDEDEASAA